MQENAEVFLRFRPPTPREQAWILDQWGAEVDRMSAPKGRAGRLIGIMLIIFSTVHLVRQPTEVFSVGAMLVLAAFMLLLSGLSRNNAKLKARLQDALRRGDYLVAETVSTRIWVRRNRQFKVPMVTVGAAQTSDDYRLPSQYTQMISDQNIQGKSVLVLQITGSSRKLAVFQDKS